MMKTIIAGSRTVTNLAVVSHAIECSGFDITEVVSGQARGVDTLGEIWGRSKRLPITEFPADWKRHGRRAGYLRNEEMAQYADALIAVWDGESRGTKHMIDIAKKRGLNVYVHRVKQ